jgi:hypothetical protein
MGCASASPVPAALRAFAHAVAPPCPAFQQQDERGELFRITPLSA